MGHQDFQGHVDKMVRMDVLEKEGSRGPEYVQFCCRILLSHMFVQAARYAVKINLCCVSTQRHGG